MLLRAHGPTSLIHCRLAAECGESSALRLNNESRRRRRVPPRRICVPCSILRRPAQRPRAARGRTIRRRLVRDVLPQPAGVSSPAGKPCAGNPLDDASTARHQRFFVIFLLSAVRRRGPAASRASRAMVRNRIQAATADAHAAWPRTPAGIAPPRVVWRRPAVTKPLLARSRFGPWHHDLIGGLGNDRNQPPK